MVFLKFIHDRLYSEIVSAVQVGSSPPYKWDESAVQEGRIRRASGIESTC